MNDIQLPNSHLDLNNCFEKDDFVIETCKQINKDLVGLTEVIVPFDLNLDSLVLQQMTAIVVEILESMPSLNVQQFIYKVDLKESDFLSLIGDERRKEELAFKIIKREAQKIYLRKYFR